LAKPAYPAASTTDEFEQTPEVAEFRRLFRTHWGRTAGGGGHKL